MAERKFTGDEKADRDTTSDGDRNDGLSDRFSTSVVKQRFQSARSGSADSLGDLFEGCRNYLLLIANQAVKRGLQAKVGGSDLVQETFIEAQRIFDRFEGESEEELLRWLTRILEFKIGNTLKRFYGTESRNIKRELDWSHFLQSESADSMLTSQSSPSEEMQFREEEVAFRRAMANLTIEQQKVVRLRVDHRLSFDEIGLQTNRSADAARKMFMRAIESFQRDLLSDHDRRDVTSDARAEE